MSKENSKNEVLKEELEEGSKNFSLTNFVLIGLMGLVLLLTVFNLVSMFFVSSSIVKQSSDITGLMSLASPASSSNAGIQISNTANLSLEEVLPDGIPRIYGDKLGVNLSDIRGEDQKKADAVVKKLASLDGDLYPNGVMHFNDLDEPAKKRYLSIGTSIACEYCCGVDALVSSNGKPACGCAHSAAMRGLAMYLLKNYPNDFTNEQIVEELGKLKALFFPKNALQKAVVLKEKSIEFNYVNLMSNKYMGIEKQSTSTSVGGATQVGGC